ncbi:MAG: hypothetical protein OEM02_05390 [Desulfobulbaceae bacterium]|nr:hypothetical protein [Desulfobulbaceae bacterium]
MSSSSFADMYPDMCLSLFDILYVKCINVLEVMHDSKARHNMSRFTVTPKTKKEAFVWIWPLGENKPGVAGRAKADNGNILFNYGKSYLDRIGDSNIAISDYEPELPLKFGVFPLLEDFLRVASGL